MRNSVTCFKIAATLVGTIVGAGFATGKEIFQFFTFYGAWGTLGVLVAGLLFMMVSTKMMVVSHRIGAHSFRELNHYLFGRKLGGVLSGVTVFMMIGVTAVMLSGAGALFKEQLGWSPLIGTFTVLVLCYLFLQKGIQGVFTINSIVVPIMIIVVVTMALLHFPSLSLQDWLPRPKTVPFSFKWLLSAVYYVSFNVVTTQAVLVPLGKEIKEVKLLKRGGVLGGLLFCLILLSGHLALSSLQNPKSFDIPMAMLASKGGPILYVFVMVLILGEILTTYVGNIYGLCRHITYLLKWDDLPVILGLLLITFIISLFDYGTLIESLYPFFGQLGLFFTFILLFKKKPSHINK